MKRCICGNPLSKIWVGEDCIACQNKKILPRSIQKRAPVDNNKVIKTKHNIDREYLVWKMRSEGHKFSDCGKAIGISATRAGQLYSRHVRRMYFDEHDMKKAQMSLDKIAQEFIKETKRIEASRIYWERFKQANNLSVEQSHLDANQIAKLRIDSKERQKVIDHDILVQKVFKEFGQFKEINQIKIMLHLFTKTSIRQMLEKTKPIRKGN